MGVGPGKARVGGMVARVIGAACKSAPPPSLPLFFSSPLYLIPNLTNFNRVRPPPHSFRLSTLVADRIHYSLRMEEKAAPRCTRSKESVGSKRES